MLSLHRLHRLIHALRLGLSRRCPASRVSFSIEGASLSEGLRAAFAATSMLLAGRFLHNPLFAWAAIGAFWTCLADAGVSPRRRFASMMGFSVLSTLLGGLTACASSASVWAAVAAILTISSAAGFACVGSAAVYQVAILVATACVVMVGKPLHVYGRHDVFAFLWIYACGCLFATVLSFTVWRSRPFESGPAAVPDPRDSFCPTRRALRHSWALLAANVSIDSMGVRHAVRLGVATTAAFLIVRMLRLPVGYWATMATLVILQPSIETTWPRSIERAMGSIAGAALAVVIGLLAHTSLAISLVVFPLVCLTIALRRVSYSLYVVFLTPTFVLVADFATPDNTFAYALARLGNNVLGCVIALLAAYLLWPTRGAGNPAGAERMETSDLARDKIRVDAHPSKAASPRRLGTSVCGNGLAYRSVSSPEPKAPT